MLKFKSKYVLWSVKNNNKLKIKFKISKKAVAERGQDNRYGSAVEVVCDLGYCNVVVMPSFTWPPECIEWYSIPEFKKCTWKPLKALLFHKYKNICIKTILWTRNTNCFTIFVQYKGTLGKKDI